ncbi:hypothetical protein DIZ27_43830 [Streptomyces sp. NWU339]|uniref:hypothetical protein n=1 Tax=Streptomyces sp. NWU339 TaxID=2185284 RepID=UPI000D679E17|nr:hypothetical protein [Streptomyces sp. NWU339]PWI04690.1 hypothetical protein DIZ27_43830 [Streptomyces sp. NWU339]
MAELNAYRIGDHVWCAATVRWVLSGPAVLDNTHRVEAVGRAWETRVLVSTTNTESRLTILRSQATRALSTSDFVAFAPSASSLAKRREDARQAPLMVKLTNRLASGAGHRALTRLERTLLADDHSPWFAVSHVQFAEPQEDDDHILQFAEPQEGDDEGPQFAEPHEGDEQE